MYTNVLPSRRRNYIFSQSDDFISTITAFLQNNSRKIVRIHEAGDFYSQEYLNKWKEIVRKELDTRFYAFTKSHKLTLWENKPNNLILLQSYGSKYDEEIDITRNIARVVDILGQEQNYEYVCPHHEKEFTKCGVSCSYCFSEHPKSKHVAFLKH